MVDKLVTTMSGRSTYDVGREVTEILTATKVLIPNDCGRLFFLDAAAGFTVTLPSIADAGKGWACKFVVKTAVTSNGYIVTEKTADDTDKIVTNGINELEVDTSSDGPYNAGHTTVTLVHSVAIQGDNVEFVCDGTNWYCKGQTKADGGVALA